MRLRAIGAVDDAAKGRVLGTIPGVPTQMLACDAHAGQFAVKRIKRFEMADEDVAYFKRRGCCEDVTACEK